MPQLKPKKLYTFYIYHAEGHYDWRNSNHRDLSRIWPELKDLKYDIFEAYSPKELLHKLHQYNNSTYRRMTPKTIKYVVGWWCGQPELFLNPFD